MEQNVKTPTELGTQNVGLLLAKYALPAIIAMTASSLLNNIDMFFISRFVGPEAISGLGAAMPFMMLGAAFGAMVGVGASSIMSIRLGQRDFKTAQQVLGNTVTLNIILSLIVTLAFIVFLNPMLYFFGASDNTLTYARSYMLIILIGGIITHSYLGLNAIIRSAGHPIFSMLCTIVTVLSNALLDWLFVWVWKWGIDGAAWATVLSQAVGLVMELVILSRKSEMIHLQRGIYRINPKIVKQILLIGLSPFFMNACACLVVIIINHSMRKYGDMEYGEQGGDFAIGAYSIVNRVVFFFLMVVMGINQGMQPIVGYNWGAHQNDRVWRTLRYAIIGGVLVTTTGWLIGECCPEFLTRIFSDGNNEGSLRILEISTNGFRIDVMVLPLVGAQMVTTNFFQSIGHAGKSIFLSLTRQLIFLIPGLLILPQYLGLDGVWGALPLSDAVSFIVTATMLWLLVRKVKKSQS